MGGKERGRRRRRRRERNRDKETDWKADSKTGTKRRTEKTMIKAGKVMSRKKVGGWAEKKREEACGR